LSHNIESNWASSIPDDLIGCAIIDNRSVQLGIILEKNNKEILVFWTEEQKSRSLDISLLAYKVFHGEWHIEQSNVE